MNLSPYFREAGSGEGVVCLHSNASASAQWRPLMERLSSRFHVFAPDSLGAGKSPAWPKGQTVGLSDEVALLGPVFALAGSPLSLVGHSYGGAIALISALTHPQMVQALVLYEPTLFSLLDEEAPGQEPERPEEPTSRRQAGLGHVRVWSWQPDPRRARPKHSAGPVAH